MASQRQVNLNHQNKTINDTLCQVEHEKLLERRMRLRETHEKVMEDELMKMERELEEQQVRQKK